MELKEMIKVMQHFESGGEVEIRRKNNNRDIWITANHPTWSWDTYDYRTKEQKEKVIIEKWLCKDRQNDYIVIETSNIEKYVHCKKVKLIDTYEVEL